MLQGLTCSCVLEADDVDKEFDFDTTTDEAVPLWPHAGKKCKL